MDAVLLTLGGLGLFLFGMAVMTSGLRHLAGDRLRQWLGKATRTPVSGALTGAAATAVVQSSSAITVAAVGFVGAGLMTFPQALGVLFGANIGTTITGWIVAVLGFKFKLGTVALPLIFVASIFYLVKSRWILRGTGKALAGFALIFLGIGLLQEGLEGTKDVIDLSAFDASGTEGRLILLFIGIAMTLLTQSSSATVAAALTALNTGVIDLPQAAAAIIGADVGTTATAALATVGGNTGSRRTGFAHVIYNLLTGFGAFLILPLYLWLWTKTSPETMQNSPELVAVAFYSIFNAFGVVLALPFTNQFARMIERLFPDQESPLVAPLDYNLLKDVRAATQALEVSCRSIATGALRISATKLSGEVSQNPDFDSSSIIQSLADARTFAGLIGEFDEEESINTKMLFAILHILDHTERLSTRSDQQVDFESIPALREMRSIARRAECLFIQLAHDLEKDNSSSTTEELERLAESLEADHQHYRSELIKSTTDGKLTGDKLAQALDAARWLRRLVYHSWRINFYWMDLKSLK